MRQDPKFSLAQSKKFRTASIFGFWSIMLWLTLGSNLVFLILGLDVTWLTLGLGIFLLPLPFTTTFKSYLIKPIDSMFFPISTVIGNIGLIILYAISLNLFATDPFVLDSPINIAGLIIFIGATALSILSLCACFSIVVVVLRRKNRR